MPDQFWSLTVREFWIKHDAFIRKENRFKAAMIRHGLRTTNYKKNVAMQLEQMAMALERYPLKPWTLPAGMTPAQMNAVMSNRRLLRTDPDSDG